jgi:hypothetical protein
MTNLKKNHFFKKYFLTSIVLISSILLFGQEKIKIDYDDIKQKVNNPESEYYYPKLLERYNNFDSTLTVEDYALIYYGFSFQYDFFVEQPDQSKILMLWFRRSYDDVVVECNKILEKDPISFIANYYLSEALKSLNSSEKEWKKYLNRYTTFKDIIVKSGDGKSCETAFKVVYNYDQKLILQDYFKIQMIYEQVIENNCESHLINPNEKFDGEKIYFDISRHILKTKDQNTKIEEYFEDED